MKITVFTSCYNQADYLPIAIVSILQQTHENIEYLLYDDGSTDRTWEIIESYCDPRIKSFKLEKQPNVGVIINRSFQDMTGDAWVWCPADDYLFNWCIAEKYALSLSRPGSVIYSNWNVVNAGGLYERAVILEPKTPEQFAIDIWEKCDIGFTGIYIPRSVIEKAPPFPEYLDCSEDYFWALKATQLGIPFVHMSIRTHAKRIHDNRTTVRHKPDRATIAALVREEG